MITTSVQVDTKAVDRLLNKMIKEQPKKVERALGRTASEGINTILDRTKKGKGLFGRFPAYDPKYADYRKAKGRTTSRVDLNDTGKMLAALKVTKNTRYQAVIGFTQRQEEIKAQGNNKTRPWFGLTRKEEDRLRKVFKKELFR